MIVSFRFTLIFFTFIPNAFLFVFNLNLPMNNLLTDASTLSMVRRYPHLKSDRKKSSCTQRHDTGDLKFNIGTREIHEHRYLFSTLSFRSTRLNHTGQCPKRGSSLCTKNQRQQMLGFLEIYYACAAKPTIENIEKVLKLVRRSQSNELTSKCTNFSLDANGVVKLIWSYRLSLFYNVRSSRKFCLKHMGIITTAMLKTTEFLTCDNEMPCYLSSLNEIQ